jgi:hypothetical protein
MATAQRSFLDPGYTPPARSEPKPLDTELKAPVRMSDPAPAQAAADAIKPKLAGLREIAYDRAVFLCKKHGDATANEIGYMLIGDDSPMRCESLRKRVRELVDLGYLIEVGSRKCRQSGSDVTAYQVKP